MTPTPLHRRLDDIEARRRAVLHEIEARPPAHAAAHPLPGKWSVLEIVEHLVLAEEAALADIRRTSDPGPHRFKHRLLYPLVMAILRLDIPVRVPARSMVPQGDRDLAELKARWDASQAELRSWVEGQDAASLRRRMLRHPVAGPMTPAQGVHMLQVHLARHIRQIHRRFQILDRPHP